MKNYSGAVATEIIALLIIAVFISPRGRALYYTLLGQTRLAATGEASPFVGPPGYKPAQGVYRFTPIGLVVAALLATKTARGAWGLFLVYFLAAILLSMTLVNYQQFLSFFVATK